MLIFILWFIILLVPSYILTIYTISVFNLLYIKWYIHKHQEEFKLYIQQYIGKNITFRELQDLIQHEEIYFKK
jgi:hypothetical protein